ncbi:MAG: SDR family NAD(P)-dependent oxidoreductase [Planctomycetota bacterium]
MPTDLHNKPILIAGASSGIGAATARACAQAGMPVALLARRRDKLERVASDCNQHNVNTTVIECDVTNPDQCTEAITRAESDLGPLHAAFANAGYGQESPLLDMSDADTRAMFETNLFGTLNIIKPAAEKMKARQSGHLLICSSCLGLFPTPWYSVYSATKAAQHHMGRALDVELRQFNIRCSTVHPVGTKTEFWDEMEAKQGRPTIGGSSEAFMQSSDKVAKAIVRCLKRPKPEVWTHTPTRIGMLLSGFLPKTTNAVLGKMIDKRLKEQAKSQARESSTTA